MTFMNAITANNFLHSNYPILEGIRAFIPSHLVSSKGIIRNIDREITEDEIMDNIETEDKRQVLKVERLKRRSTDEAGNPTYIPTNTLLITFRGKILPKSIYLFHNHRTPQPYIPRTIQCHGCMRYGHPKKNCKNNGVRCPPVLKTMTFKSALTKILPHASSVVEIITPQNSIKDYRKECVRNITDKKESKKR